VVADVNNTGGKFAAGFNNTGGQKNSPPVLLILTAIANIFANFRKNSK
jgi:hypothetical protein